MDGEISLGTFLQIQKDIHKASININLGSLMEGGAKTEETMHPIFFFFTKILFEGSHWGLYIYVRYLNTVGRR